MAEKEIRPWVLRKMIRLPPMSSLPVPTTIHTAQILHFPMWTMQMDPLLLSPPQVALHLLELKP
jgi:hypothetical protein